MSRPWISYYRYQALITLGIFFGLFFVEYPPLFLMGYWSWSPVVAFVAHKTISGVLIIVNLLATQYIVRRLGFFQKARRNRAEIERETAGRLTAENHGKV